MAFSPANEPIIELNGVRVAYGATTVLEVSSLRIAPAECVFVLGRSGSGKTTLARVIKSRVIPSAGVVRVLGTELHSPLDRRRLDRRIAMIDQEFFLVPRMTVVANVLMGSLGRVPVWQSLFGWYPVAEWEKAESILDEVELDGLGGRRVEALSGGQRQRVAIARALMQEAEILLADEPISNLDPELAEDALRLLVRCVQRRGMTLLVNLHQPRLARLFATRFLGLADGRIVSESPPERLDADEAEEFIHHSGAPAGGPDPAGVPSGRGAV